MVKKHKAAYKQNAVIPGISTVEPTVNAITDDKDVSVIESPACFNALANLIVYLYYYAYLRKIVNP